MPGTLQNRSERRSFGDLKKKHGKEMIGPQKEIMKVLEDKVAEAEEEIEEKGEKVESQKEELNADEMSLEDEK